MDRRGLMSGALAASLCAPSIGFATKRNHEKRVLTSHIEFRHSGRTVRPVVILTLAEGRAVGWQINGKIKHFPAKGSLLSGLGKGLLRDPLETRIARAKPYGDVYLHGNVLALDSIQESPLPNLCSVTHGDTEWQIDKRPKTLKLRNLPEAGRLFRTRVGRSFLTPDELVIFVTPTVVRQPTG